METRENYDALFQESPQAAAPAPSEPRAPMDKEAWAAKQKEQRETLYERADRMADAVLDDPAALQRYLKAQALLGRSGVTNTLLLMEQCPGATRVHSFEEWQRMGRSVKRGEQASLVFERGREYVREDGSIGAFQNVKRVFDVRQTAGKPLRQPPIHPVRNRLKALMTNTSVPVRLSDEISQSLGALYQEDKNAVQVARGLDGNDLFFVVARELARAETRASTFACDCVANIMCNRYGMTPRYSDQVPEEFANLEPQGKREVLVSVRNVACAMMERMDRSLSQILQPQEKRQDAPQR